MPIQSSRAIRRKLVIVTWPFLPLLAVGSTQAQEPGPEVARELERLSRSDRVETIRIGESPGGREILVARISGRGNDDDRPASPRRGRGARSAPDRDRRRPRVHRAPVRGTTEAIRR